MKKIAAIVITALFCVAIIVASCHLAPRDTVYATDPVPCNSCGVTLHGNVHIVDGAFYCNDCAAKLAQ